MTTTVPAAKGLGAPFRRLWAATSLSNLGDGLGLTALPLLAATLTRDPVLVAGVATAAGLPWLLAAAFTGTLLDRVDRRRAVAAAQFARAAAVLALVAAVALDAATIPLLYVVAFLMGVAETVADVGAQTMVSALVPRERMQAAQGQIFGAQAANQIAGPALAGQLFAVLAVLPFLGHALLYVASGALVAGLKGDFTARAATPASVRGVLADLREGFRWLWANRLMRVLTLTGAVYNLAIAGVSSLGVLVAQELLGLGAREYGWLLAALGVGGVLGGLSAGRVAKLLGPTTAMSGAFGLSAVALAVIAGSDSAWVVAAMLAVMSFGMVISNVVVVSLRQNVTPKHLLGRVMGMSRVLVWGAMPLGALLGGAIAGQWGLRAPFVVAAMAIGAMALIRPLFANARAIAAAEAEAVAEQPAGT